MSKEPKKEFKPRGHTTTFQGLPIVIENPKGSVRSGVDNNGKPWHTVMKQPYGYIKGSRGADGEGVDVFIGPHKNAPEAHVVHQYKPNGRGYDEDKVILGFKDKSRAIKSFLDHYDSPKVLGPVKTVAMEHLKGLVATGKKLVKISSTLEAVRWAAFLDELGRVG